MSVPLHRRKESDLSYLIFAEELQQKTNDAVMNEKYVPKKYRYIWTQTIFNLAIDIYQKTRQIRDIQPFDEYTAKLKLNLLLKAKANVEALKGQIGFARKNFSIPSGTLKEWEKICVQTKSAIATKFSRERENLKDLLKN